MVQKIFTGVGVCILIGIIVFYGYLTAHQMGILVFGPPTGNALRLDKSISDGVVRMYHTSEFMLASYAHEAPIHTPASPCADGFLYCLHHATPGQFEEPIEAAGLSMLRADSDAASCITDTAKKTGAYVSGTRVSDMQSLDGYQIVSDTYRLWTSNRCYTFIARIIAKEQTDAAPMKKILDRLIAHIELRDQTRVEFKK